FRKANHNERQTWSNSGRLNQARSGRTRNGAKHHLIENSRSKVSSGVVQFSNTKGIGAEFLNRTTVRIDYSTMEVQLLIDRVRLEDEGIYRCRIDYRWAQTAVRFVQLELIGI